MTPPVGIVSKVRHATLCTNSPYNFFGRTLRQKQFKLYMIYIYIHITPFFLYNTDFLVTRAR